MTNYGDEATVREILTRSGDTWAVVGLSNNTARAAYGVAQVLQRHGKRIVPVHPKAETVLGEPATRRSRTSRSRSTWWTCS